MPKRSRNYKDGLYRRLQDDQEALVYLQVAIEESIPAFLTALRNVAEARQMSHVAQRSRLNRVHLYRMLQEGGNPRLNSLEAILRTLGLRLSIERREPNLLDKNTATVHFVRKPVVVPFEAVYASYRSREHNAPTLTWDDGPEDQYCSYREEAQLIEA